MVSFVVNTNNYRARYDEQKTLISTLQGELSELSRVYDELQTKMKAAEDNYLGQIQDMRIQNNKLIADLQNAERQKQDAQARADSWKGVLTGFEQSIRNLQQSLQQTQNQLDQARAQGIRDSKELNQITLQLYEKIVQLEALEADRRRLLEQKQELETQVGSGTFGGPSQIGVVTPLPGPARPVAPVMTGTDIRGLITEVKGGMVTLSVGTSDGVQKDMVFHVTRGDQFLCDVVITNVDINKSAGVLELIQQQPRIGDTASTKL